MDDALLEHLKAALLAFLGKAVDFCLGLLEKALSRILDAAVSLAGAVEGLAAKIATVPLWITIPAGLVLAACVVGYAVRQRLYDRLLVYGDVWLLREGFRRRVFWVRRGAVRRRVTAMARRAPLPERFAAIALYEAAPDRYVVAYGPVGDTAQEVRFYRRDRRAGLFAMGEDLIRHFRATVRMLRPDGELRALFDFLDALDPDFAACRPGLPGESRPEARHGIGHGVGSRTAA